MSTIEKNTIPCRKMFTDTLLERAKTNRDIVVVTSDARGSVTLDSFAKELPQQFVEVGIAEQDENAINGTPPEIFRHYGLDSNGIYRSAIQFLYP